MATRARSIEERVSDLEREVAALKAAGSSTVVTGGFAEEGQPALTRDAADIVALEQRVAQLESSVAQLKSGAGATRHKDWRRTVGGAKDDPDFDEAVRFGAEWRRRENLKSIRELERRGEIDADPGHRSSQRPASRRKASRKPSGTT